MNYVQILNNSILSCVLLIASVTLYGDWQVIQVHWIRMHRDDARIMNNGQDTDFDGRFPFQDFPKYWMRTMISAYCIYFLGGLFFHYFYYTRQRDHPERWKCQPHKWLSAQLEWDEIKVGCLALSVVNTWAALVACYIANGGYYCAAYNGWNEHSVLWLLLQIPLLFVYEEFATYWVHRILHWPTLYRLFHSVHHRYRQPTAFSVVAMHPIELTMLHAAQLFPLFNPFFPVYWPIFQINQLYMYAMGLMNHSGVYIKAQWWQPWQPDTMFHDSHHQYYHVNFGFNCTWWDKLFDTMRKPEYIYREDIYGGRGKSVRNATRKEIEADLGERETENRAVGKGGYNPYVTENIKTQLRTYL